MRSVSVGYPRGTHSGHIIGCYPISLGSVQCGRRSKNNSRHITDGKGHVLGMPSVSPLFSLDETYGHLSHYVVTSVVDNAASSA